MDKLQQLEDIAAIALGAGRPSIEEIEESVRRFAIPVGVDEAGQRVVIRRLETRFQTTMSIGALLEETEWQKWVSAKRVDIDWFYWDRYRKLLLQKKRLSPHVVGSLNTITDTILDQLQDPTAEGEWDRRGLVMGHVQSGKTANYIGLINKAADAGYRVIIVVAGSTNILRRQTQLRIDEGFTGFESSAATKRTENRYKGVGDFSKERPPVPYTNALEDFKSSTAQNAHNLDSFKHPAVFVIKKNSSTLSSLVNWLESSSGKGAAKLIDLPMLLVDDEADNASINTKAKKGEISAINGLIRKLLSVFTRSSYVGYSATPFANIFIDPDSNSEMEKDDLFPRNFMLSLDPPSNYFGPETLFGDNMDSFVRVIDDNAGYIPVPHKKELEIRGLPPTLETAIRAYVVGRAVRILRGQARSHSSMMVNVSTFNAVQAKMATAIRVFIDDLRESIIAFAGKSADQALKYSSIDQLNQVFKSEFSDSKVTWDQVYGVLKKSISPIDVIEVNNQSRSGLDYEGYEDSGRHVIAVGGYSLSRGVTLEGLQVSYFLRNSIAYDTLMQMGRWFGYRDGYMDLCRVWMPAEASAWYSHIAETIDILRSEIQKMERIGATPKEFGLRVRTHPDRLIITARNKMGTGQVVPEQLSLSNMFCETIKLCNSSEINRQNLVEMSALIERISSIGLVFHQRTSDSIGWWTRSVPSDLVASFVERFRPHPVWMYSDSSLVAEYIRATSAEYPSWDVLIPSLKTAFRDSATFAVGSLRINCPQRTRSSEEEIEPLQMSEKGKVASRGIEKVGLTAQERDDARIAYESEQIRLGRKVGETGDQYYRALRKFPLLILHMIHVTEKKQADGYGSTVFGAPTAAWSISFPKIEGPAQTVGYWANKTFLNDLQTQINLNEDEEVQDESA